MDEYDKQRDIEAEGQRVAIYHDKATYAETAGKTLRTIKAHVDKDGNVALVAVGLSPDEIKTACDRIKVLVS